MGSHLRRRNAVVNNIRALIVEFQDWWEETQWQASDERKEMANLRLAAHRLALQKGSTSPYLDPALYDEQWKKI